jgi:8-oxo-dGTP diphosphatase
MVARADHVLLARWGKGSTPDPWGFPGGLVEVGETVAEAAARELKEETGITAEPGRVVEVLDIILKDGDGRVKTHFILHAVPCRWLAGEPAPASDVVATDWFTLDQIATMPSHPNLGRLAAKLLTGNY